MCIGQGGLVIQVPVFVVDKVDQLYESLAQRTSEVYVQRAKQLYATAPMRSALFTWSLDNLEVFALADQSYNGRDNVLHHMTDIDPLRFSF